MEQGPKVRVVLKNICKSFPEQGSEKNFEVVKDVSLEVYDGEFLVLLGPGRCGKSVLLNITAGLMEADSGQVLLDDQPVTKPSPEMGMVFQKTGMLPWKTVMGNVSFGPKMRGVPKKQAEETAQHYIDMVGLKGFEKHYAYQLSGGMKQRVGIARAYANDPKILIMDEPFGALDAQTRYSMQNEILRITAKEKRTVIFITNNIEEAIILGDRIVLFTKCPAQVKAVYPVDMPKPRDTLQREFLLLRREISDNADLAL